MEANRPRLFIGSSAEGLRLAEAVQANLDYDCEATIWSQGFFGLNGGTTLETLVDQIPSFDFAALVITADDLNTSRSQTHVSPRDNVILELGLCIGALGRTRTFIVFDRLKQPTLPSDLAGVTVASFASHSSGNLNASLGAATSLIKTAMKEQGLRSKLTGTISPQAHFQIVHDLLDVPSQQFLILMYEQNVQLIRTSRFTASVVI